ncbi:hypothetical protein FACS1894184_15250 [Clostridia bacterium]|nr:hypothetical protein FACS1894184_15250 [Clostridia bacterium]
MSLIANYLVGKVFSVFFVIGYETSTDYPLDANITQINLGIHSGNNSFSKVYDLFSRVVPLKKVINKVRPDLIISFLFRSLFTCVLSLYGTDIPLLTSIRNDPDHEYHNLIIRKVARYLYNRATLTICQNAQQQKWLYMRRITKSVIIPNPIEMKFFNTYLADGRVNLIGVGRLEKQKNWRLAIEAYSRIAHKIPDDFLIYGEGSWLQDLEDYANSLKLSSRIHFIGHSDSPSVATLELECRTCRSLQTRLHRR